MPHVINLNFPEYMFALYFLHATGDNFGKQKQHKMKELSIPCKLMKLFLKRVYQPRVTLPSIICILHKSKPYLNNFAVVL